MPSTAPSTSTPSPPDSTRRTHQVDLVVRGHLPRRRAGRRSTSLSSRTCRRTPSCGCSTARPQSALPEDDPVQGEGAQGWRGRERGSVGLSGAHGERYPALQRGHRARGRGSAAAPGLLATSPGGQQPVRRRKWKKMGLKGSRAPSGRFRAGTSCASPTLTSPRLARVMSLTDGSAKMSKSNPAEGWDQRADTRTRSRRSSDARRTPWKGWSLRPNDKATNCSPSPAVQG